MLPLPVLRAIQRFLPRIASGRALHRRALAAHAAEAYAEAECWFESAAARYREELAVEPLARLRVHQLMARAHGGDGPGVDGAAMIEIVRRLNRLDRLENLSAPFELVDARTALAQWIERADPSRASGSGRLGRGVAAG
jgi:hypothetical protein